MTAPKPKTILLGGGGFIGGRIKVAAGLDVYAPTSAQLDLTDGMAVGDALAARAEGAAVIYSAGIHRQRSDSFETLVANQLMIKNLCAALDRHPPASVVFLSSVEVYGAPPEIPVTEATPLRPLYQYAVGKVACELLLQIQCRKAGVPLTILRLPGVYGPADGGGSILGKLVAAATGGPTFRRFGDGSSRRDYVHVDDVAWIAVEAARRGLEGIANVATGIDHSLNDLIALVSNIVGPCRIESVDAPDKEFDLSFDTSRLLSILPDFKPTTVEAGLATYRGTDT